MYMVEARDGVYGRILRGRVHVVPDTAPERPAGLMRFTVHRVLMRG